MNDGDKTAHIDQFLVAEKYQTHEQMQKEIIALMLQYVQFFCKRYAVTKIYAEVESQDKKMKQLYLTINLALEEINGPFN